MTCSWLCSNCGKYQGEGPFYMTSGLLCDKCDRTIMVNICDMCDGRFPDNHNGKFIAGAFWYCNSCAAQHDIDMEDIRKKRKAFLNSVPDTFRIECRGCDDNMIEMKRDKEINKLDDLCDKCKEERDTLNDNNK